MCVQVLTTLLISLRHQSEGEYDPRFNFSGDGLIQMAEVNNPSSLWKQVSIRICFLTMCFFFLGEYLSFMN